MGVGLWITVAAGVVALAASLAALVDAQAMKRREGGRRWPLAWLWSAIALYCACFVMMRVAHMASWPVLPWYYAQTVAGAGSAVSLFYILAGIVWGGPWTRIGAEFGGAGALVTLTLLFAHGVEGPRVTPQSIEYLPASEFARAAIGIIYAVLPIVFAVLVAWVVRKDVSIRRRMAWFAPALVLMYVPNALRYVVFMEGTASVVAAAAMAMGTVLGWRSYHTT